jgi:hypothetical protein
MTDDRPVTVTVERGDATVQLDAVAVDDGGPRGYFAISEPSAYDSAGATAFDVHGEELLLVAKDRVVAIEGDADALDALVGGQVPGGLDALAGPDDPGPLADAVGDDEDDCPECDAPLAEQLGGVLACPACGWTDDE